MHNLIKKIMQYQFSTIISIASNDIFDTEKHIKIKHINSTRNPFSFRPTVIIADPFLFVHDNELFVFYEEQVKLTGKGVIKMIKTKDLKKWSRPKLVLEEPFHLSFPNVFEIEGQIFMIPETGKNNSINLYIPNSDLTIWKYYKTLISGKNFVDSSIVFIENNYFLFTTDFTEKTNLLRLYYSESLQHEWVEHLQSPIAQDLNKGRCAGSLFFHNGNLYRPCQLSTNKYGEGVDIYKINLLSKKEYVEKKEKSLIPNKNYKEGGHHFNKVIFKNQIIIATDILELKINFFEVIRRIKLKLFK